MGTLTEEQWREVLAEPGLVTPTMWKLLRTIHARPGHEGFAGYLGKLMGYTGKNTSSPLNSTVGKLGRKLMERYDLDVDVRYDDTHYLWQVVFDGEWHNKRPKRRFIWRMRPELVRAFEAGNHAAAHVHPEEIGPDGTKGLHEGALARITVNSYERNARARRECIEHYGATCAVCSFDFGAAYGAHGQGFIHVHHLVPVATTGENYVVDPVKDLRPVCPNCHAMLHRGEELLSVEELKSLLRGQWARA